VVACLKKKGKDLKNWRRRVSSLISKRNYWLPTDRINRRRKKGCDETKRKTFSSQRRQQAGIKLKRLFPRKSNGDRNRVKLCNLGRNWDREVCFRDRARKG